MSYPEIIGIWPFTKTRRWSNRRRSDNYLYSTPSRILHGGFALAALSIVAATYLDVGPGHAWNENLQNLFANESPKGDGLIFGTLSVALAVAALAQNAWIAYKGEADASDMEGRR